MAFFDTFQNLNDKAHQKGDEKRNNLQEAAKHMVSSVNGTYRASVGRYGLSTN
ncbi:MAG: hypothetical protein AAGD88_04260 [Bacteroidota bacterium]